MKTYERCYAEINLDVIAHNIREIKTRVGEGHQVMAIVKADGYGHGAVEISKVLLENGADTLGVAIYDEGLELRRAGFDCPILVLGYVDERNYLDMIDGNLNQTVYCMSLAEKLSAAASQQGKTAKIHIKVDTGMSRLGFLPTEDSIDEIERISRLPGIEVVGLYTHLAASDGLDKTFAGEQFDKYKWFVAQLESRGIKIPIKHVSNSGAIVGLPECYLSTVRAGIMMYGLMPSDEIKFGAFDMKPVLSWKAKISFVKTVDKGISIGYGRTFFTDRQTVVATVPVGYADGFSRQLSNRGRVLVRGCYAPIIGRVCMDQFMIDVTDIPGAAIEDEVVLIGEQGGNRLTAEEMARLDNTINYEIVCKISKRVPRVYVRDGKVLKEKYY